MFSLERILRNGKQIKKTRDGVILSIKLEEPLYLLFPKNIGTRKDNLVVKKKM